MPTTQLSAGGVPRSLARAPAELHINGVVQAALVSAVLPSRSDLGQGPRCGRQQRALCHPSVAGFGDCDPGAHLADHRLLHSPWLRTLFASLDGPFSTCTPLGFASWFSKPETVTLWPFGKLADPAL